jgi:hypothetical protein
MVSSPLTPPACDMGVHAFAFCPVHRPHTFSQSSPFFNRYLTGIAYGLRKLGWQVVNLAETSRIRPLTPMKGVMDVPAQGEFEMDRSDAG